jgi:hypothetical protein
VDIWLFAEIVVPVILGEIVSEPRAGLVDHILGVQRSNARAAIEARGYESLSVPGESHIDYAAGAM